VALQKRLDVLSADESVTQGRVDALKIDEVRLKTVSESVEKKTVELRETQASLEQARRDVKSNSDELSRLQSSVVGVRATLETLEQQKQAADDAAKIAATASAATKKELDPLVAQLNKLKSEVADQERKLTGTRDDLVARIGDLQARFSKAHESYGILTATLEMLQADIAERRTALEKMKLDEVRRKELEEATARLSAQRDDLQTRIRALEDQIAADAARPRKTARNNRGPCRTAARSHNHRPEQPKTSDTIPLQERPHPLLNPQLIAEYGNHVAPSLRKYFCHLADRRLLFRPADCGSDRNRYGSCEQRVPNVSTGETGAYA